MKFNFWSRLKRGGQSQTFSEVLRGRKMGSPLRSGRLSMIPLFRSPVEAELYAPPERSLSLSKVTHYGEMILRNSADKPTIAPLHMGYFQKGAQNHAMCRTGVFAAGEERQFKDACCIQASQGGYIKDADERFIILPEPLRALAFSMRGEENYSKLWSHISSFNAGLGLKNRGHLDELKQAHQPQMLRALYRLERGQAQTGAMFFLDEALVGLELAPSPEFWAELHNPLVMYCYAPLNLALSERTTELDTEGLRSLEELAKRLSALEEQRLLSAAARMSQLTETELELSKSDGHGEHRVVDVSSGVLVGQAVFHEGRPAYVSMTRPTALQ